MIYTLNESITKKCDKLENYSCPLIEIKYYVPYTGTNFASLV